MKRITLLATMLFSLYGYSQNFEWVKTPPIDFDMNHDMIGYCTAVDPSGNIYFTGFKDNAFPYDEIMGDQYFNKYTASGELIFSKEFTGRVNIDFMTTDSQGNVLMAVNYVNNLSIGDLTFTNVLQDVKHHIFKFDTNGNLLWQQEITITDWFVHGFMSIELDASDNIYIGFDDFQNSYIRKMSPDGTLLFTIEQTNAGRISSVSVDSEGNIYAAGSCVGPDSVFGSTASGTNFDYNTYAVKYSPAGVFQWIKFVEDITCPAPHIVATTPDEVYFSSQLYENSVFDDIEIEGPAAFFEDMFIAKLNAMGEYQWVRELPGEGFMGVGKRTFLEMDAQGNVYFAGRTGGNVNWGNGIQTDTPTMSGDLLVLKYNPHGQIVMAKTAGGANEDRIDSITLDNNGTIYITGMVSGDAAFGSLTTTAQPFEAYPFLAKISQGTLGNDDVSYSGSPLLYPNPADCLINFSGVAPGTNATIHNMLGQEIMSFKTTDTSIDISGLETGTYIVKTEGRRPVKFVKR
jgi:outer membrane protein assembly factor BamB